MAERSPVLLLTLATMLVGTRVDERGFPISL